MFGLWRGSLYQFLSNRVNGKQAEPAAMKFCVSKRIIKLCCLGLKRGITSDVIHGHRIQDVKKTSLNYRSILFLFRFYAASDFALAVHFSTNEAFVPY